jgi:hypothetical protein
LSEGGSVGDGGGGEPLPVGGGEEVLVSIEDVGGGYVITAAVQEFLEGEAGNLQGKRCVLFDVVAGGADERARIGVAVGGKAKGEVVEAGVFGGGEEPAGVALGFGEIEEDGGGIAVGVLFSDGSKGGETGGGFVGGEGVAAVGLVVATAIEQDAFAGGVD